MNPNPENRLLRIGLVAALALAAAAAGVLGITSRHSIFEKRVEYFSVFPDAAGLKEGAGVWFQGVEVGYVARLEFNGDPDSPKVLVHYRVQEALVQRMRTTTRASIKSLGLLGDKYLSLSTPQGRSLEAATVAPGREIPIDPTVNLEALGKGAQDVMEDVEQIAKNLNQLITNINEGGGVVSRLLKDPKMGQETVDHLGRIAQSLDTIAATIARGEGFAGKMLADKQYGARTAQDLSDSLHRLNGLLADVREGRGGAGALLSPKGQGEAIVADLAKASKGFAEVANSLNRPGTLGNRLLVDDRYGEHLAANLLSISDSLASILRKADEGKGTLGALVNDRSVYDSLSAVAEGLKKSALVRWYLQRKAEDAARGAKAAGEKRAPEEKKAP